MEPNQSFTNGGTDKGDVVYIHGGILLVMKKEKVGPHYIFEAEIFLSLTFKFCFVGGLQKQRADVRGWGDEWDQDASCEAHK